MFHIMRRATMLYRGTFSIHPVTQMTDRNRQDEDTGGKIILPSAVLDFMANQPFQYPMLFKLMNPEDSKLTHCGVLEFVADEGTVYAPSWMLEQLGVESGALVRVESITLPVAVFSRFQPQSSNFLDISNPKAVLENQLRKYACLTVGDVIALSYNDKIYRLKVEEARPNDAVTIIECDMEVDFSAPVGYIDPNKEQQELEKKSLPKVDPKRFRPFSGVGHRLDGKESKYKPEDCDDTDDQPYIGIPDYDYKVGTIEFFRTEIPIKKRKTSDSSDDNQSFPGDGRSLE